MLRHQMPLQVVLTVKQQVAAELAQIKVGDLHEHVGTPIVMQLAVGVILLRVQRHLVRVCVPGETPLAADPPLIEQHPVHVPPLLAVAHTLGVAAHHIQINGQQRVVEVHNTLERLGHKRIGKFRFVEQLLQEQVVK